MRSGFLESYLDVSGPKRGPFPQVKRLGLCRAMPAAGGTPPPTFPGRLPSQERVWGDAGLRLRVRTLVLLATEHEEGVAVGLGTGACLVSRHI